jgi:anti-sigma-K factor RskA
MKRHEKKLSRMLDGDLSLRERASVESAMGRDPALGATRKDWERIGDLARSVPVEGMPAAEVAWQDVRRAIRTAGAADAAEERIAPTWRLRWAVGVVAAVCVAILLLGAWRIAHLGRLPALAEGGKSVVEWAEAEMPGSSPMVYEDAETGCVVIWMVTGEDAEKKATET